MRRFIKGFLFLIGLTCFIVGTAGVVWVVQTQDVNGSAAAGAVELTKSVPAAGIRSLNVRSDVGDIIFKPAADGEIKARFTARVPEARREDWTLTADTGANGTWSVVAANRKHNQFVLDFNQLITDIATRNFNPRIQLEITIPPQAYEHIVVHTDTGHIELGDMQAGTLDASTSTGAIDVNSFQGDTLNLHSSTGKIRFQNVSASGNVIANTNTGKVEGSLSELASPVSMATNTGAVMLHLPADSSAQFDLSTNVGGIGLNASGNISYQLKEKKHTIATMGAGTYRVNLHTDTGKVEVNEK